jgi:hypothetical protein
MILRKIIDQYWDSVARKCERDENCRKLRQELHKVAKEYEAMTYERLLAPAEELSTSREINGFTVHFSAEAYDIKKNGDICFCIDAEGLPTKARWKPSYRFFKRKDGSVYH